MSDARITEKLSQENPQPSVTNRAAEASSVCQEKHDEQDAMAGMELCTRFAIILDKSICGMMGLNAARVEMKQLITSIKQYMESYPNKKDSLLQLLATKIKIDHCDSYVIPYCLVHGGYFNEEVNDPIILHAQRTNYSLLGTVEDYLKEPQPELNSSEESETHSANISITFL